MQELAVFFCANCGRYGYFQFSKRAVCPGCHHRMTRLMLPASQFLRLDPEDRDRLLSAAIMKTCPAVAARLREEKRENSNHELAAVMNTRIQELEKENQTLSGQVTWMHQIIWKLVKERKEGQQTETSAPD